MSAGDLDGDKYLLIWERAIVDAVIPVEPLTPVPKPHKAPPSQRRPARAPHSVGMLRGPPPPVPAKEELAVVVHAAQAAHERTHRPTASTTLGDHLATAKAPPRRRGPSEAELGAQVHSP
jgi:hypothetical protein